MEFIGRSLALSAEGLAGVANSLSLQVAEIWSVLSVETHGTGFLPDRRPQILFERHIFSKLTQHQFDASHPDISALTQGGYGAIGAHQYDRLQQALALDEDAALKSTSWGLAQIMGFNFQAAGFGSVTDMVTAMVDSEDAQMQALCDFIGKSHLQPFLAAHDWTSFARSYNGPQFAENKYDQQLRGFYAKYSVGAFPDLLVRAAQLYLTFAQTDPHGVDGVMGKGTRDALVQFQTGRGLQPSGAPDTATMAALLPA